MPMFAYGGNDDWIAVPSRSDALSILSRIETIEARSFAAAHVADIRQKITDLQAMEAVLSKAICDCEANRQTRCPLIEVLSGGASI